MTDTDYERLHALALLLDRVHRLLAMKGRSAAADVVLTERNHFLAERDIARASADAAIDLDGPTVVSFPLGDDGTNEVWAPEGFNAD